jgi:uncharacterized membrane protein YfcA
MEPAFLTGAFLLAAGALIGLFSGVLGLGGGFLLVPVQYSILTTTGLGQTLTLRVAFGTSLAVILPTAISGAYGHHCRECVVWKAVLPMGITGVFGAFLGGTIASHAPGQVLSVLFGLILLAGAWRMIAQEPHPEAGSPVSTVNRYLLAGFAVGFLSGLLGIGGGVLMVPLFVLFMRFALHQAIGTSTALIVIYSAGGIAAYVLNGIGIAGLPQYSIGYIDLQLFAFLAATSIPLAQVGVRIAHGTSPVRLKQAFSIILVMIGLKMIGVFNVLRIPFLS